ncbi:MAG: hypothetical protein KDI21_00035 [Halieaceae bacterium]|nr:hypothetical protein [Halieaceae bacterium]
MKTMFKPLGLAAAVAAVSAGYAGVANAQTTQSIGQLGDLGIIPYYTVQGNWVTGVHIINSSDLTQVVKLRLRRGSDSADALDFNLIMSPKDEWTGFIDDSSGDIVFATDDNTCTAPIREDGRFPMPFIFREGAEEGYIEVIGMGSAADNTAIAYAAKHVDGVPRDCGAVASNFFANGVASTTKGIVDNANSVQAVDNVAAYASVVADPDDCVPAATGANTGLPGVCNVPYTDAENGLKVSYFFRDATAGTEMGNNAVHIADFSADPWMSNQETGLFSGDVFGFDFPDLDGGPWVGLDFGTTLRGTYNNLRDGAVLGVSSVLNDWSVASARNVSTDWVVTLPGQYTMIDYITWASGAGLDFDNCATLNDPNTAGDDSIAACDFRDIPVTASIDLYDREEGVIVAEDGDLVISPAPPGERNDVIFPYEVNVIQWTDGTTDPVLPSDYATTVDPSVLGEFGWASLAVSSTTDWAQWVCQFKAVDDTTWDNAPALAPNGTQAPYCVSATGSVPMVGFVAWQRSFPSNPDANYGRLVEHSFTSGVTAP